MAARTQASQQKEPTMDQQANAAAGDEAQAPIDVVTIPASAEATTDTFNSVSQAARALARARHAKNNEQQATDESGAGTTATDQPREPAEAAPGSAEADAAAEAEAGGTAEAADPTEPPPIEPPRSWSKEDKELFAGLPRETQMRVAERERARESDFLRRQNEAVEQLKGLAAREQAAELARRHYVDALPNVLKLMQAQHADEFADIKSPADVERIAKEDMPRYVKWSESQRQIGRAVEEVNAAQASALRDAQQKWFEFATRQDALFAERVPEAADPEKNAKMQEAAIVMLKGIGFTDEELGDLWNGRARLPLRDHRVALLIHDATRYRQAQQKAKDAAAKPVPPVQRPGVAQPRGAAQDAKIQALAKQLETSGSLKDAAALIAARRKAGRPT
jgi:hypothetical protein